MSRIFPWVLLWLAFASSLSCTAQSLPIATLEPGKPSQTPFIAAKQLAVPGAKPKIALVIDDLGDNSVIADSLLNLPAVLTVAVLPHTPQASKILNLAARNGHEIIMHLPMEAHSRPDLLGPGALMASMDKTRLLATFSEDTESMPQIVGFNNHMGSLLTEDNEKMAWLMREAKAKGLYFLDSKTSQTSVAQQVAQQFGVATIGRDVFLDHQGQNTNIATQLEVAKRIAARNGRVVIICHPYPHTLDFLRAQIDQLSKEYELVHLSQLLVAERTELAVGTH